MNILLIAGHGGGDPGAVGNGYREADLARELVYKIKQHLNDAGNVKIFDTSKNMYRYLKNKNTFDFSPYNYVLEVHFNAGISETAKNDGKTTGTEILIHKNEAGTSVEDNISQNISSLGFKNRGVKRRADLQNMNIIFKKGVSYALLETCFIDDATDMTLYAEKKDLIAKAIADGIKKGFGILKKQTELTTVNDIVWALAELDIISDKALWLEKLEKDQNAYWLAKKCANRIINN